MAPPAGRTARGQSSGQQRARRRLLADRLPLFAAAWLGTLALWMAVYALESRLAVVPAIVLVVSQAAILGVALAVARRDPNAQRVREVAVLATLLLGLTTMVGFAVMGGPADVISFAMLTLYLMAAITFAWGWQNELIVYASTIGPLLLVLWAHGHLMSSYFVAAALVTGTVTSLLVAEISRRNLDARVARGESEARFRGAFNYAPVGMVIASMDGRLSQVNRAFCDLLGYEERELLGKTMADITYSDDVAASVELMRKVGAGAAESLVLEKRYLHKDGHAVLGQITASLLRDGDGMASHFIAQVQDVSTRKRWEDALRASEARYRGLVESQHDLIARTDTEGRVTFANDAYCEALGLRQADIAGRSVTFFDLVHSDDLPAVRDGVQALLHPPHRIRMVNRNRAPEGWRWFEWETCGIRNAEGETVEFQATGRDITERRAAENQLYDSLAQLHRSEDKLRALALRQVSVRESERKRLGLDLHDDVCQELVGVGILIESLRRRLSPMSTDNAATFDRVGEYVSQLVEHLRVLARDLQPLQLRDYGLTEGLRSLALGMSSESVSIETSFPEEVPRLDEGTEVGVYRIAQEALTNAVRHAGASAIELAVTIEDEVLRLVVTDDGRGFDAADCPDALGIVSMEERVMALGGRFTLRSAPGEGTTVAMECQIGTPAPRSHVARRVARGS